MPRLRHWSILLSTALLAISAARADYSTEQIRMAATGRYDLLEKSVEDYAASNKLTTRDQHALCYAYSKTKRYNRLLGCLEQLESKIRQGDRRTRLFGLSDATPTVYLMRAEAFIELGHYAEAAEQAGKALAWLKDDGGDDLDMIFNALSALSLARSQNGDEAGARQAEAELAGIKWSLIKDYSNANALARARMGLKDYPGVIAAIRGDTTFAINVFLERLVSGSFLTGINNWVWAELPRAFMLNKALLETGQIAAAKSGFDQLLNIAQVKENGEIYWLLLNDRGRIAEQEGLLDDALGHYRQAVDIVELQRASINTEASKIGFVGDKQALYSRAIDLASRLNRPDLAFEYIERSKSRALVDLLAARDDKPAFAAKDGDSRQLLEKYLSAKVDAAVQLPLDMAQANTGSSRLSVAGEMRELRAKAPELASLITVNALPTEEILRYLRPDEALLEFFGFGDSLYGVAMNGKERLVLRFDAKQPEADIREFRNRIQAQDQSAKTAQLASSLYRQLILPFEGILGNKNLVIVPHGALHYLPFAALHDGKGNLVARRNLRFLPSSSVQKYIRPTQKRPVDNILIYGNPDLDNKSLDLPGAENEAKLIAGLLPKSSTLTRKNATETSFKKLADGFSYLHIASHGQFKAESALDSRLLLAGDADNDGSLTVRELYDVRLNAELVTLSACETGLGKALSGDDLIGLTRGFLYAGASNVVASLWEVDDEATTLLMKSFYNRLKAGTAKKEALRQAQLDLQKTHPAPVFWAAFYLTGEGI